MKLRKGVGLSAAAVALLFFAPAAFAGGEARPAPDNTITYSAQSVALATPANSVSIPSGAIVYQTTGVLAAADSVNIKPSVGTFIAPVPVAYTAGACTFNPGALQADGSVTYTVATACSRNTGQFELTLGSGTITGVSNLAVPGGTDIITARATVAAAGQTDTTPTPVLTLASADTFVFSTRAAAPPLAIDLTGAGSTAGTQFTNTAGTGVTQNGFLGTFTLTERQDYDARGATAANPTGLLTLPLLGTGAATIAGNFAAGSITSAYLVPNPGTPASASCNGNAPAGSIAGTVSTTQLTFPFAVTATNLTAATPSVTWAVCVFAGTGTTATVLLQATSLTINAAIVATGITTPPSFNLTAANTSFGSIVNNGTVASFQQVFFTQNGYTSFLRAVNPNTSTASVFFQLVVGVGPAPGTVFNGTATTTLAANTGVYLTANQLATIVGFTPGNTPANGTATVRLMSPAQNIQFSNLSINPADGALSALP